MKKIHFHINPDDELGGYTNICLGLVDNRNDEVNAHVDDAEANEIILNNVLEYILLTEITDFLGFIIGKLRHDGTLVITGVDAYTVAKDYVAYKLSIEDFNILLHGAQQDEHFIKTATLTLHGLVNFLQEEFGLEVVRKTLEDYTYVIEAKRP